MDRIQIGQRVRVIDAHLVHYRQVGTVMALHADEGCYVHLDYDDDLPESSIFFHSEEIEAAPDAPPWAPRRAHWSADTDLDRSAKSSERA